MPYEIYKWLHLTGGFLLLSGLIAFITYRKFNSENPGWKKLSVISHGIGLVLILISGFGMAARLGLMAGFPAWLYVKIAIWLALGAAWSLIKRRNESVAFYFLVLVLFSAAAFLGATHLGGG